MPQWLNLPSIQKSYGAQTGGDQAGDAHFRIPDALAHLSA